MQKKLKRENTFLKLQPHECVHKITHTKKDVQDSENRLSNIERLKFQRFSLQYEQKYLIIHIKQFNLLYICNKFQIKKL